MGEKAHREMVECGTCGIQYDASERTARDIRAGRVEPRCAMHRTRRRRQTRKADYRRFWLDRFDFDEIEFMARCLSLTLRPSQTWSPEPTTLTAAGAPPGPRELGGGS